MATVTVLLAYLAPLLCGEPDPSAAFIALVKGRYQDAERHLMRYIHYLRLHGTEGDEGNELAAAWNSLGGAQFFLRKYSESERSYLKAYALWSAPAHPTKGDAALVSHNLAELYSAIGRYSDADYYFRVALRARTSSGTDDARFRANVLTKLGENYLETGHLAEATKALLGAAYLRAGDGGALPELGHNYLLLARLCTVEGNYAKAEGYLELAAPLPHSRARFQIERARLHLGLGEAQRALDALQTVLDAEAKKVNPDAPVVIRAKELLATLYYKAGDTQTARRHIAAGLELAESEFGPDHPETARLIQTYIKLFPRDSEARTRRGADLATTTRSHAPRGLDYVFTDFSHHCPPRRGVRPPTGRGD